jgi:hypothetical protein
MTELQNQLEIVDAEPGFDVEQSSADSGKSDADWLEWAWLHA